uniref:Uncharacterized protein n=1 Tax=Prolemur simus TaxID=1328070 RepID=A0A8C9DK89_PROSS
MTSVSSQLVLVLISLLLVLPVVEAVEAGDPTALLLGVVLSLTGICACLRDLLIKPHPEDLCPSLHSQVSLKSFLGRFCENGSGIIFDLSSNLHMEYGQQTQMFRQHLQQN